MRRELSFPPGELTYSVRLTWSTTARLQACRLDNVPIELNMTSSNTVHHANEFHQALALLGPARPRRGDKGGQL
jgi:hypothetical protein